MTINQVKVGDRIYNAHARDPEKREGWTLEPAWYTVIKVIKESKRVCLSCSAKILDISHNGRDDTWAQFNIARFTRLDRANKVVPIAVKAKNKPGIKL